MKFNDIVGCEVEVGSDMSTNVHVLIEFEREISGEELDRKVAHLSKH